MAGASIHTIPVTKETTERLRAARRPVLDWNSRMLVTMEPYPAFSGQHAQAIAISHPIGTAIDRVR